MPSPKILCALLQHGENALVIEQGCAGLTAGSADRTHRVARSGRRAASPIQSNLSFRHTQELRRAFLDACDRQQQVAEAARLAACHLAAGHPPADLIALMGHALLREDAGFHMVQNLQAAVQQYLAWHGDPEAAPILIAAARYLAAHSPTLRARHQTAQVARRLMLGGAVHEDVDAAEI